MNEDKKNETGVKTKKMGTRNLFPRLPLIKAISLAKQIYELGEGDPVPRLVVFDRIGKSPDSGTSRMLVTTSNAYGLTTGGYQAERLGITDRGKDIVNGSTEVAVSALLSNDLFSKFYEKYQNKTVPQEAIGVDFLKQTGNLPESDAKVAYGVFLSNLTDYGFVKEMSGRPTIVSQSMMDTKPAGPKRATTSAAESEVDKVAEPTPRLLKEPSQLLPQFNFNIQVQLPENATPETYEAIFKSMAEHLLNKSEK